MATHRLSILAFAALPFIASGVAAQDRGLIRSWDRNRDGVVTRAEWQGTAVEFRNLDMNRDGVLSGIELREIPDANTADAGTFESLDRNDDGLVSRAEWRGDRETFFQVDRNNDNRISRREFMNANVSFDPGETDFDVLDANDSGRIEPPEWRGTRPAFNRLDINNDGMLTRREFTAADVAVADRDVPRSDPFDMLDYNNNGVITRDEWRSSTGSFNQRDLNRDGVISRGEYSGAVTGGGAPVQQRSIRMDSREPWTNTGIYVNAGEVITIRASGNIQMSTNPDDRATPGGSITGRNADSSPRPEQRAGVLLGRLGNGAVFVLGADGSVTAPNSGELHLGINDDHFPDNSGGYNVEISVRR